MKYFHPENKDICPIDCGDNSCLCSEKKSGMRTNGGCRCERDDLKIAVMYWKRRALDLRDAIDWVSKKSKRQKGVK